MIDIHTQAEALANEFRALGRVVEVAHSVNRNGDYSSYLTVSGIRTRLRLSDHYSATTDAYDVFGLTAQAIIDRHASSVEKNKAAAAALEAEIAKAAAARQAAQKDAMAKASASKQHRIAFFRSVGIDFDACRGAEREAARAAYASFCVA
jgi:topoisomerase IA-like protein